MTLEPTGIPLQACSCRSGRLGVFDCAVRAPDRDQAGLEELPVAEETLNGLPVAAATAVGWVMARQLPEGRASRSSATLVHGSSVAASSIRMAINHGRIEVDALPSRTVSGVGAGEVGEDRW
ncbi:hypothetical protein GCM10010112_35170 [Actinoplanes lobatus]|uniref:Uncharacterized protein n=1 Tax=Actinoplanes lobatus TaxID=113568 RepID=A0ABQ4AXL5_9ACTN|nr:hypothetical protein GCM10010112_35170 [Actinoplanes lobatus]GIE45771.1 hypothetical protein Alo02nite_86690 [Actinoplanes lobatus]